MPDIVSDLAMKRKHDVASVKDRLRLLCSRREYCSSDIYRKALQALDGDSACAAEVLEALKSEKYVDDLRYACAYSRDKSAISGWGARKIRFMLSSKGVPQDVIDEALLEVDESRADQRFHRLMYGRYMSMKDDPQVRVKLLRYALGRGYRYDEASSLIDVIIKGNYEDTI